jgi:hypothetical protein
VYDNYETRVVTGRTGRFAQATGILLGREPRLYHEFALVFRAVAMGDQFSSALTTR